MPTAPPLGLYIHVPWCVRKCPYCDFNSHALGDAAPFDDYCARLLLDLEQELADAAARRPLQTLFIGGGTPSLMPGANAADLLDGIRARAALAVDAEITLEANPGTAEAARFAAYRCAGVNRLSIGAQSLSDGHLARLGRIHGRQEIPAAVSAARAAGFDNLNLDLMFALPGQTLEQARSDLLSLIDLGPEHVSYYQLTLEPNTAFHADPPELPDADLAADMAAQGRELLAQAGYLQYEVSAYAKPGRRCRHNLGYWRFGDYLGIGAGAHGKLTEPERLLVRRRAKRRHPADYLDAAPASLVSSERVVGPRELVFEFALNAFRLTEGFERSLFESTTGMPWSAIAARVDRAAADGLLREDGDRVEPTELGLRFADDLVMRFLDEEPEVAVTQG